MYWRYTTCSFRLWRWYCLVPLGLTALFIKLAALELINSQTMSWLVLVNLSTALLTCAIIGWRTILTLTLLPSFLMPFVNATEPRSPNCWGSVTPNTRNLFVSELNILVQDGIYPPESLTMFTHTSYSIDPFSWAFIRPTYSESFDWCSKTFQRSVAKVGCIRPQFLVILAFLGFRRFGPWEVNNYLLKANSL